MKILEHVSLAEHTTLRLGGAARFFVSVSSVLELREALAFAKEKTLPIFILGGGSNTLFTDEGWTGLVIQMKIFGRTYEEGSGGDARVIVGAGEVWDQLVEETVTLGLWGLENLSRIPGTVGASPVQNIGAYGVEVKDVIDWVEVLDKETNELHIFSTQECAFAYRDSFFKHREGKKYIVTRVAFRLSTYPIPKLEYKDLRDFFGTRTDMSVKEVREAVHAIREKKFPELTEYGTAGSFFKNPIIHKNLLPSLEAWFQTPVPSYEVGGEHVKVPLGWMLERMNWKGRREGHVGCWENQSLVLVHYGNGTASELILFANKIVKEVKEKTTINIVPEVVIAVQK